jgi:hypothetical protein
VVSITGLDIEVSKAMLEVHTYLRNIDKEEGEMERAELLSRSIQWSYVEGQELKPFDPKSNADIEKAFEKKKPDCTVTLKKEKIKIDFNSMKGSHKAKDKWDIIRRDLFKGNHIRITLIPVVFAYKNKCYIVTYDSYVVRFCFS